MYSISIFLNPIYFNPTTIRVNISCNIRYLPVTAPILNVRQYHGSFGRGGGGVVVNYYRCFAIVQYIIGSYGFVAVFQKFSNWESYVLSIPFDCQTRRVKRAFLRMKDPVSQQLLHDKDPSLL